LKKLLTIEVAQYQMLNDSRLFKTFWYLLKISKSVEIFDRILEILDLMSNITTIDYKLKLVDFEYIDNIMTK
jgi:hypothetical protein